MYDGNFESGYFHNRGTWTFKTFGSRTGLRSSYVSGQFAGGMFIHGSWQLLLKVDDNDHMQYYWYQQYNMDWIFEANYRPRIAAEVTDITTINVTEHGGRIVDINGNDTGRTTVVLDEPMKKHVQFPLLPEPGRDREIYW